MAQRGWSRLLRYSTVMESMLSRTSTKLAMISGVGFLLVQDQTYTAEKFTALREKLQQYGLSSATSGFFPVNTLGFFEEGLSLRPARAEDHCLTRYAIADAAAKAAPGVVNITVDVGIRDIFMARSSGSGTIIQPDGTILTNAHVVANAGKGPHSGKIIVTLHDGRTFTGQIVSSDTITDIAVIKINCKESLPTVKLGSSRRLRAGEWVIAVGSPLQLKNSLTVGIISAVERKSSEIGLRGVTTDFIQTDAAINQGNSGGPLLNLDGEVIGINTMKAFVADGVGFAIPIDTAVKVMNQLKKHGHVVRPWLGMKMLELTRPIIDQLRDRDPSFPSVTSGVLVPQVIPGSPAERGGVRAGDVVVEFDGKPVRTVNQIVDALGDKVGVSLKMVVKRNNDRQLTLVVVPEEAV